MKTVIFSLFAAFTFSILSLGVVSNASAQNSSGLEIHVLPFKVWKQKKIDEAIANVSEIKREVKNASEQIDHQIHQVEQAEINLNVARDLSANDYFVLYLTPKFKGNREALIQASKHLSVKDFADIMAAYQKALETDDILGSKTAPFSYQGPL